MKNNDYQTLVTVFPSHILVEQPPEKGSVDSALQQAIDRCWQEQQKRCGDQLFDGKLLNVTHYSETRLIGHYIPYSWYVAWMYDPKVRQKLAIAPMGISGLTFSGNRILIGRRSGTVAAYPGAYEFVPSGGVDPSCQQGDSLDLHLLLQKELTEEAAIAPEDVVAFKPLALVRHCETGGIEACVAVEITEEALNTAKGDSSEYSELHILTRNDVSAFLEKQGSDGVVDLTAYMWSHFSKSY